MPTRPSPSSEELAGGVAAATTDLGPADWLLAGTLLRLLADGGPVEAPRVQSRCRTSGEPIALTVGPEAVEDVSPASAVISALLPEQPLSADVIRSFCSFIHFFASEAAATEWTAKHEGTFTLSIADGFKLGLLHTARMREALG